MSEHTLVEIKKLVVPGHDRYQARCSCKWSSRHLKSEYRAEMSFAEHRKQARESSELND